MWWFTKIYICKNEGCGYAHEYEIGLDPDDDICPKCHRIGLWRQVMDMGQLVDYNPKKHN